MVKMNYTGKEFMDAVGLTERQFHYWKKKGLFKKHYVVERKRGLYTQWEVFVASLMIKVVRETPISVQFIHLFRKSLEELLMKMNYPAVWAKRLHLIMIFHFKHKPVPWRPWYDIILCGSPIGLTRIDSGHLVRKTIDLAKLWPKVIGPNRQVNC